MQWNERISLCIQKREGMTKKKYVPRVNPHDTYNRCAELLISSFPPFYPFTILLTLVSILPYVGTFIVTTVTIQLSSSYFRTCVIHCTIVPEFIGPIGKRRRENCKGSSVWVVVIWKRWRKEKTMDSFFLLPFHTSFLSSFLLLAMPMVSTVHYGSVYINIRGCLQVNNERLKTAQLGILLSFSLTYAFFFQDSFCGEMGKEKGWKENEWNEEGESDGKKRRK